MCWPGVANWNLGRNKARTSDHMMLAEYTTPADLEITWFAMAATPKVTGFAYGLVNGPDGRVRGVSEPELAVQKKREP